MQIFGWQINAQTMARILPFALYMAFLAIEGAVADFAPAIDVRWLYTVKIDAVLAALWTFR